jgi:hypothetical protein
MVESANLAWRRQVLEEATRLRGALKDAQKRRQVTLEESLEAPLPTESTEMKLFEEAQAKLKRNTTRLEQLRRQVEENHLGAHDRDDHYAIEAANANLVFLEMAEQEMERTQQRMKELEAEDTSGAQDADHETENNHPTPLSETKKSNSFKAVAGFGAQLNEVVPVSTEAASAHAAVAAAAKEETTAAAAATAAKGEKEKNIPKISAEMIKEAESTWTRMAKENPITTRTNRAATEDASHSISTESSRTRAASSASAADFAKPKTVKKEEVTFDVLCKDMHLTSSPLVFFNLACFQSGIDAEMDVMLPICGYAVAGRMLCVMGPSGTNSTTLRVALSEPAASATGREVHVADFTVGELVEVCDSILRPENVPPAEPLLDFLGLRAIENVQVGTCIQRGAAEGAASLGTPRGAHNPDMPTPRNPNTPRFRGTGVSLFPSNAFF